MSLRVHLASSPCRGSLLQPGLRAPYDLHTVTCAGRRLSFFFRASKERRTLVPPVPSFTSAEPLRSRHDGGMACGGRTWPFRRFHHTGWFTSTCSGLVFSWAFDCLVVIIRFVFLWWCAIGTQIRASAHRYSLRFCFRLCRKRCDSKKLCI